MIRVFCAALENSGRNWIQSCLAQHPELEVTGDSFPSQIGEARHYPVPDKPFDYLVIVCRDKTCQTRGVARRGYNQLTEGRFQDDENMHVLQGMMYCYADKCVFVSYETALRFQQEYWKFVFWTLGVAPVHIVTEYRDENVKYMNDGNGN